MKKLGKLNINPEKVMKNEELTTLKGGDNPAGTFDCKVMLEGLNFFWDTWIGEDLMTVQGECTVFYSSPCYCFEW